MIATLYKLWQKFFDARSAPVQGTPERPTETPSAMLSIADHADQTRFARHSLSTERPTRPLRVVRIIDAGGSTACGSRLFMSGRMADVCAELDRLAACELRA